MPCKLGTVVVTSKIFCFCLDWLESDLVHRAEFTEPFMIPPPFLLHDMSYNHSNDSGEAEVLLRNHEIKKRGVLFPECEISVFTRNNVKSNMQNVS